MNQGNPYTQWLWIVLASFAGALTALSFRPFRDMSKGEITLALFVGMAFAIFVGPWAVRWYFGAAEPDLRIAGGIFYLMASGSNALIPFLVRKMSAVIGTETKP